MYYTNKILYKGEELELLEISEGFSGLFGNFFKDDVTVNFKISKDYNKVWCKSSNPRFSINELKFIVYDSNIKRHIIDSYEYYELWYDMNLIAQDYKDKNVFTPIQAYILSRVQVGYESKQITKYSDFNIVWNTDREFLLQDRYESLTMNLKSDVSKREFIGGLAKLKLLGV